MENKPEEYFATTESYWRGFEQGKADAVYFYFPGIDISEEEMVSHVLWMRNPPEDIVISPSAVFNYEEGLIDGSKFFFKEQTQKEACSPFFLWLFFLILYIAVCVVGMCVISGVLTKAFGL